jgi:hypothetical protein
MLDFTGAACLEDGVDIDAFFSDDDGEYSKASLRYAKLVCRGCPLIDACFQEAVAEEHQGVWGGLTEAERKRKVSGIKRAKSMGPGTLAHKMAKVVNKQRSALAADFNIPIYSQGLREQGHVMPDDFLLIVKTRVENPNLSLSEVGSLIGVSKDAVSGRLRRLKESVVSGKPLVFADIPKRKKLV